MWKPVLIWKAFQNTEEWLFFKISFFVLEILNREFKKTSVLETWHHKCASQKKQNDSTKGVILFLMWCIFMMPSFKNTALTFPGISFILYFPLFTLRPLQTRIHCCGHIVVDTNVSPFAHARNICWTNISRFAQPKKHNEQQCALNNVSATMCPRLPGPLVANSMTSSLI